MLDGELGEAKQTAMGVLVALGKIYDAEKMIPVKNAQVAGVSYKTIGDAGLEYLEHLADSSSDEIITETAEICLNIIQECEDECGEMMDDTGFKEYLDGK